MWNQVTWTWNVPSVRLPIWLQLSGYATRCAIHLLDTMYDGLITVLFRLPIREISPLTYKWMKDNSSDKWQPWWCINFAASISFASLISNSFSNKPWVMYHQRAKVATLGLRACLVILFSFLFTSWCITSAKSNGRCIFDSWGPYWKWLSWFRICGYSWAILHEPHCWTILVL